MGWIVVGVIAVIVVVVGIGTSVANRDFTVTGTVTLHASTDYVTPGNTCDGAGVNSWLHSGTTVNVMNGSGTVIAASSLDSGVARRTSNSYGTGSTCVFAFTVNGVPGGSDTYEVEIGSVGDDPHTYSHDQMESGAINIDYGH